MLDIPLQESIQSRQTPTNAGVACPEAAVQDHHPPRNCSCIEWFLTKWANLFMGQIAGNPSVSSKIWSIGMTIVILCTLGFWLEYDCRHIRAGDSRIWFRWFSLAQDVIALCVEVTLIYWRNWGKGTDPKLTYIWRNCHSQAQFRYDAWYYPICIAVHLVAVVSLTIIASIVSLFMYPPQRPRLFVILLLWDFILVPFLILILHSLNYNFYYQQRICRDIGYDLKIFWDRVKDSKDPMSPEQVVQWLEHYYDSVYEPKQREIKKLIDAWNPFYLLAAVFYTVWNWRLVSELMKAFQHNDPCLVMVLFMLAFGTAIACPCVVCPASSTRHYNIIRQLVNHMAICRMFDTHHQLRVRVRTFRDRVFSHRLNVYLWSYEMSYWTIVRYTVVFALAKMAEYVLWKVGS